jgi:spore coat-associated protein N
MISRKKLALLSATGVLAISLTIGGATYALFGSTATNANNIFIAGTLNISSARDDIPMTGPMFYADTTADQPGTMKTGLWAPGDKNTRGLFLENTGTLDAKLKTLSANTSDANGNAVTSGAAYNTDVAFANASELKIWQLNFFSPFGPFIPWPKLTSNQLDDLMQTVNAGYTAWEANHPGADPLKDPNLFDQLIIFMNQYMLDHINEIKQNNAVFNDGIVKVTKLYSQNMNNIVNNSVDVSSAGISIKPHDSVLLAYTVKLKPTADNSLQGITPYFSFGSGWAQVKNN